MLLLLGFAALAGAGTALTPCVLPVLPALLSASATGGRRRPLGIIVGLVATHTLAIVAVASVIDGVGLADGFLRTFAICLLLLFGVGLLVPALGERIERPLARLGRFGPSSRGTGFRSGLVVGGALGFVYAPCAGPIVAAVIALSATQGATAGLVALALAYGIGSAVVLLAIAYGGRRVVDRLRRAGRGPLVQRALGVVMVATAVLMLTNLDLRFQTALASDFPDFLVNPTGALERSDVVEDRLADLRGRPRFDSSRAPAHGASAPTSPARRADYPVLGTAPELAGTGSWFNTPGGRRLTLAGLRGRVVLIDFWTYTCINCIRTLPHLRAWDRRYRDSGLTIVGVHTPEFSFEREEDNVRRAVASNGLRYPVAQDNDYAVWSAFGNQYWPAKYLIDAEGRVRYTHFGEGAYDETEAAIRALLEEAGSRRLGGTADARSETAAAGVETPETYLGWERAERFLPRGPVAGTTRYSGLAGELPPSHFSLSGVWRVGREAATAVRGASLDAAFGARKVFLVMSSRGERARRVRVLLDGRPIAGEAEGSDVEGGFVTVRRERLYELVSLAGVERRRLGLELPPGVTGYAFTFG